MRKLEKEKKVRKIKSQIKNDNGRERRREERERGGGES